MAAVRYPPMIVTDPTTGLPLNELRGQLATVVLEGTTTPVTLTQDLAGTVAMSNPVTVTNSGFTPLFYVQDAGADITRVDLLSGGWRTPLDSPQGLEEAAAQSAAAALTAAGAAADSAADVAADLGTIAVAVSTATTAAATATAAAADATAPTEAVVQTVVGGMPLVRSVNGTPPDGTGDVEVIGGTGEVKDAEVDLAALTEFFAYLDIVEDEGSTGDWPDRFRVVYRQLVGGSVMTFWLNEYGELRVTPAKSNTVGARIFVAPDPSTYAARHPTVPVLEVSSDRTDRVTQFAVYGDGDAFVKKDLEVGGGLIQAGAAVGAVYTLEAGQDEGDIPAGLPAGTLIVRKTTS